jgi:peptidoglycan/xylan/chitin deacetylase (PgdA/CDA1 family)
VSASAAASLKRLARRGFRLSVVAGAARRVAAIRGHSLVILYHRILPHGVGQAGIVPTVTPELFIRQIQTLGEIGRIVSLDELLQGSRIGTAPRFALTFDDDYASHVQWVLPALRRLGIPGTFFLSGRTLHGVGAYWFEALEQLIVARGLRQVGALLGMTHANGEALAAACEMDPHLQRIVVRESNDVSAHLREHDIEALVQAGMTIGFHTLDHSVLPELADADLDDAVVRGRDKLAAVVGSPLVLFAYPHGRTDGRVTRKLREAGYIAAWTGRPRPMRPGEDRYLLGRWEPGPVTVDDFVATVSIRLNRDGRSR